MKNCLKSGKCNGCGKINVTVFIFESIFIRFLPRSKSGKRSGNGFPINQSHVFSCVASIANSLIRIEKKMGYNRGLIERL